MNPISVILTIRDILRGRKFARTVQSYMFGPPDDLQAVVSYRIWRRSLGHADTEWTMNLEDMRKAVAASRIG